MKKTKSKQQVVVVLNHKTVDAHIDVDGDLISNECICKEASYEVIPDDGSKSFWVTYTFELYSNQKRVHIKSK